MSAASTPIRGLAGDVLSILTASTGPGPSNGVPTATAGRVLVGAAAPVEIDPAVVVVGFDGAEADGVLEQATSTAALRPMANAGRITNADYGAGELMGWSESALDVVVGPR